MPEQALSPPAPLQSVTLTHDDLNPEKDPSLSVLNGFMSNIAQMLNYILGHSGTPVLKSGADFNGKPLSNVGTPTNPGDVVTQAFADSSYGAAALLPHFEVLGKKVMQSYRRLNDTGQREHNSSFLNSILNTSPTANTALVSGAPPSGGTVAITVSSGQHQRVDASQVPFALRTDTFTLPPQFTLTSLTRSGGGSVTGVTSGAHTLNPDDPITIVNPTDPTFIGSFVVLTAASPNFTYFQAGPAASTGGGFVSLTKIYYYTISRGQNRLGMTPAGGADTWSARTGASLDGSTIIAVVTISSLGIDPVNSAGGATAPSSGASVPVVRRM